MDVNRFGSISDKIVQFNSRRGLFSGISKETIPIWRVTSVSLGTHRPWIFGSLFIFIGIGLGIRSIVGLVVVAYGIFLVYGYPKIVLNIHNGDHMSSVGWPWDRADAIMFADILNDYLVKRWSVTPGDSPKR